MEEFKNFLEVMKTKDVVDYMIAVGVILAFILLSSLFAKIVMKLLKIRPGKLERKSKLYALTKFIWIVSGIYIAILLFKLPQPWMYSITKIYKLIIIYGLTRLVAQFVRPSTKFFEKFSGSENGKNERAIEFGVKFVRGIIYVVGAFIAIAEIGYDLSGLVTGLGIGSVVIALAAQDLAKNMFGGFAILTDKTFIIGDTIEVKGIYGTVEDISFRTTRIRKIDDTVVTVPNSVLADSEIINWNKIKRRRYDCSLKVGFDKKQKEINDIIKKLSFEFQKNKEIIDKSARVYFAGIEQDGYKIAIYMYTKVTNYDDYLEFINNINSSIIEVLDKENVKLIYPTYHINT